MWFTGSVEDFYVVPEALPPGGPGDLIRLQPVDTSTAAGRTTLRVMYHSRDAKGRDRAVTGLVAFPTGAAPDGGWPVLSWGHGTCGLGPLCALSRTAELPPDFGFTGVVVATDYVGLGPVGEVHPYLSKPSEGHAMIDAVRAARRLPDAHAGARWLSLGHSQGGHAALAAAELAADYAPELELLGTVAFAPASDLDKTYGGFDEIVARIVGVMALYGAAAEHPEIDPDDYVGADVAAVADVIRTAPLDTIISTVALLPQDTFYRHDPLQTEPARSVLLANEVGTVLVDAPLLLVAGTADVRVCPERVRSLHARLGALGQSVELVVLDGADHDGIVPGTTAQVTAWLEARLSREPSVAR